MSSYDVRLWNILTRSGKRRVTYAVRWFVNGRPFSKTFSTKALAESYRSKLVIAQREGVAFDEATGLPEPMARELKSRTWLEHAIAFVDMKWARSSAKHRKSIAEALTTVTPVFITSTRGAPSGERIRAALNGWAFNKGRRESESIPQDVQDTLRWLTANTVRLSELSDAALVRKALDTLAMRLDGKAAAATTVARKRAVLYGHSSTPSSCASSTRIRCRT